jgi:hypothetical protein
MEYYLIYLIFRLYESIYILMHATYSLKPQSISLQYMQCKSTIEAPRFNGTRVSQIQFTETVTHTEAKFPYHSTSHVVQFKEVPGNYINLLQKVSFTNIIKSKCKYLFYI